MYDKMAKSCAVISKVKYALDINALRTLYCTLFLPYLNYCSEIWGIGCKTHTNKIVIIQKRIIRIVSKVGRFDHTNVLFHDLKLLKFPDLVNLKISTLMYKANNGKLPVGIQERFCSNFERTNYNLRQSLNFRHVFSRTVTKSRCLSIYGVRIYYGLPLF